ncbi:response regulator [Galbibacter sp. EGI 63066]|uniref:hybrid sensor histidine kinase/response regulator transcription factor n=1 Tax=Galbibacter sp. EGI 63066 TaxID=2993559 RepID=UPI0022494DBA|nr:hybrid sensor histidine kinase/response regulator transcription factor [Galbibacter sp. EGI 63066]MCX2682096.1 response regulator [Galbibacter sp. EGI 63066]
MGKKIRFLFAFCTMQYVLCTTLAIAQEITYAQKQISFRELTVEQGLSQNSVVSIAQDSTGYMWFATQDGLNRYDGKKFTYFNKQFEDVTRQHYSKLGKVYFDNNGILWAVTVSGILEQYNPATSHFVEMSNIKQVSTLFQDSKNNYYIGTYGKGLYKINPKTKDTLQLLKPEDLSRSVYGFLETGTGILVSTSGKIIEIKGNTYQYIPADTETHTNFNALSKGKNSSIYLGSYGNGLFIKRANDETFRKFTGFASASFPTDLNIEDILVDTQQRLWVGTYGNGVFLVDFNTKNIRHFTANKNDPYALHYNDILCLYEDFTGTIWIGTDGAGLSYYDEHLAKFNVFTNKQAPQNINVDVIRAIAVNNGTVWLGTSGKGLTRANFKTQQYKTLTNENSALSGNRIMSLLHDGKTLWIGHQTNGLQVMDVNGNIKSIEASKNFTIWKMTKGENDNLWLCTRNHGLILFDKLGHITKRFNIDNSALTTNNIRTAALGKGSLWIGSESDGLFRLDNKTNTVTKINAVPDKIKSLYFDGELLWVGTNGNGLISYNPNDKTVRTFTTESGLSNNVIYGILSGDNGNLWLSSNKGITKFSLEGNNSNIENYRNYDGLQASEFNTGAYFKDANGTLYFGGLEGLNWFKPNRLTYNPVKPKTVITGIKVFNKHRVMKEGQRLKHSENTLTFDFASLHFSQPKRNQFQYRLLGNDTEWIAPGNTNTAHYTNLPPNDYEFQVISSNYDSIWNTVPATYSFTILKPWYTTYLAIIGYTLLLLMFSYYFYRYLKWRWQVKNQLRLEHEETERLKKLDELKTKLYTNISHEFRTPLTLIAGPVENQLNKPDLNEKDKKELGLVKYNTNRLLELINQMMDLSVLDSAQGKLHVSKGNLNTLLLQLIETFQYKAKQKKITVQSTVQGLHDCWFDKDVVEKVATNLLSNAIKYAPKNSTILFNAKESNNTFILTVVNETKQLNSNNLSRVFKRFYQDNETSEGVGVGLALVKELVILAKGTVAVNTIENTKIQFTVSLPVDKAVFEATDFYVESEPEPRKTSTKNASENKPVLLLVEDNKELRNFIASNFRGEYQILEAESGKTGIEQAQKHLPDLIISDVMMPVTNGFELCDAIKQNELTSHIPIILLTAKVGEENEIQGFNTGADAYITKPFSTEKLKVRVEKLIEIRRNIQKHFNETLTINPDLAITDTETEFLKRLQVVLDEHITNPEFTAKHFGRLMAMSRTQLHCKLKAVFGASTTEFIRAQRAKLAGKLLKETKAAVSQIAYQVGFNSVAYFNKVFKDVYGITPGQHRSKSAQ